jgi:putative acetyltransferase
MGFIIRKIIPEDNFSLAKMIREVFDEFDAPRTGTVYSDPTTDALFELFRAYNSVLWVAEMDGMPVGCCGIYPTPGLPEGYAELVKFYLSAASRGKGFGKKLLDKCIISAREAGFTHLYIESLPVFSKAIGMYEAADFYYLEKPYGNSGHNSCNVWMLKTL